MEPLRASEISKDLEFEIGQQYVRQDLHEVCGGNHQPGISPTKDLSAIFLFGSTTEEQHGYRDKWLPDGRFLLTGVGRKGNQRWEGSSNRSLANHHEDGRRVFLFEKVPGSSPTVVTYVGEFEYVDHREDTLPDKNDELRKAYRFELRPVGGENVPLPTDTSELTLDELYDRAVDAAADGEPVQTSGGERRPRSEAVREFALRAANGVCQGCFNRAPFLNEDEDPYLEVHHLHRRSDDGPDHPDNVIALCPNCHRKAHHGQNRDEFNQELTERVAENRS